MKTHATRKQDIGRLPMKSEWEIKLSTLLRIIIGIFIFFVLVMFYLGYRGML